MQSLIKSGTLQDKLKIGQQRDHHTGSLYRQKVVEEKGGNLIYLPEIPQLSFQQEPITPEELGSTKCDPDKGMTWKVNLKKIPLCMADCVKKHELDHVDFRKKKCSEVVSAYRAVLKAIKKFEKSKSESDLKKAEKAGKEFKKTAASYEKWVKETCRESEGHAYQKGIDACNTNKVRKQCATLKKTYEYNRIMKQWESYKKNPPNCAGAPKKKNKKSSRSQKNTPKSPKKPQTR